jgi:hypothetical protein
LGLRGAVAFVPLQFMSRRLQVRKIGGRLLQL